MLTFADVCQHPALLASVDASGYLQIWNLSVSCEAPIESVCIGEWTTGEEKGKEFKESVLQGSGSADEVGGGGGGLKLWGGRKWVGI